MIHKQKNILTFDEKKAAEAAFRGLPVDQAWSHSAQEIYYGIVAHTQGRNIVEETTTVEETTLETVLS